MVYGAAGALFVALIVIIVAVINAITSGKRRQVVQIGPALPAETDTVTFAPRFYDYAAAVPASDAVADDWFAGALFVGDSRMQGFGIYGLLEPADFLVSGGVSVEDASTYRFETESGATVNLVDQLANKKYDAVYLMFGLNELGWQYPEVFAESYGALIDTVRSLQPNASVYIHTIIPVTASVSGSSSYLTNERIALYNGLIKSLAASKQAYLLDAASELAPAGSLAAQYAAANGIGLEKTGYEHWLAYLKTHTVDKELYT